MSKRSLGALVVLNLVLLVGLAVVSTPTQTAHAQFGAGANYLMISGPSSDRKSQDAIYILELKSARMIAMFVNTSNDKVEYIASREIARDVDGGGR